VKDPYAVLRQKEHDAERVRKEIQALLAVIPLIADDAPAPDILDALVLDFCQDSPTAEASDNRMAELERYYPFVRHQRS
jgi:hypothetical protein